MQTVDALALLAALAQTVLVGYLFVGLHWPESGLKRSFGLRLALAFGCGVGFSAAVYLALYRFATPFTDWCFAIELVVAGLLVWRVSRQPKTDRFVAGLNVPGTPSRGLLAVALFLVANTITRFVVQTLRQPAGATDAFTMWNVRARYLFSIRDDWASAFDRSFNTPDYPLLLPAAVARCWRAMGVDTPVAPAAVAFLFTLAIILCLFGVLRDLRGRDQACLGIIGLLSAPMFIFHAATQYADIVMAYLMCATVGTLCVGKSLFPGEGRLLSLAGFLAGLAAWTKNEGVLFLLAVTVALSIVAWRNGGRSQMWADLRPHLLGLALPCLALIYFKVFVVPPSEFVSEQAGWMPMLEQLLELHRHIYLLQTGVSLFFFFTLWPSVLPVIVILGFCVGVHRRPEERAIAAYPALVLIQMCLGYYVVCIIGPHDFDTYVEHSAFRLLVQLWPLIMLLAFLVIRPFPWIAETDA